MPALVVDSLMKIPILCSSDNIRKKDRSYECNENHFFHDGLLSFSYGQGTRL